MADEINTEIPVTENEEFEMEPSLDFSDEDDAEWDNVTWGSSEDEEAQEDDIDDSYDDEAHHAEPESVEADTDADEGKTKEASSHHEKISVVHNHETVDVDYEEAKPLIQKGLNYDKILGERDELKASMSRYKAMEEFLEEIKGDYSSIEDLIDGTRAAIMQEEGMGRDEAMAKAKNKRTPEKRVNADEFVSRYPSVKAADIPQSVWDEARKNGGDLVAAYSKYESSEKDRRISDLEAEIAALKQNKENEERSSGSRRTAGSSNSKSLIQALWDDDD